MRSTMHEFPKAIQSCSVRKVNPMPTGMSFDWSSEMICGATQGITHSPRAYTPTLRLDGRNFSPTLWGKEYISVLQSELKVGATALGEGRRLCAAGDTGA